MKPLLLILMAGMMAGCAEIPREIQAPANASSVPVKVVEVEWQKYKSVWPESYRLIALSDSRILADVWKSDSGGHWMVFVYGAKEGDFLDLEKAKHSATDALLKKDAFRILKEIHTERLDRPCTPETALTCDVIKKTEKEWPKTPIIAK